MLVGASSCTMVWAIALNASRKVPDRNRQTTAISTLGDAGGYQQHDAELDLQSDLAYQQARAASRSRNNLPRFAFPLLTGQSPPRHVRPERDFNDGGELASQTVSNGRRPVGSYPNCVVVAARARFRPKLQPTCSGCSSSDGGAEVRVSSRPRRAGARLGSLSGPTSNATRERRDTLGSLRCVCFRSRGA